MRNGFSGIFGFFALVMILTVFWQPLVWLLLIIMGGLLVFGLRVLFASSKIKKEMNQDPDAYFNKYDTNRNKPDVSSADIIDVEYTEREVSSDE